MNAVLENPPHEVAEASTPANCTHCHTAFEDRYFKANGAAYCGSCIAALQNSLTPPGSAAGRFTRAMLFGSGAAAASAVAYGLFMTLSGLEFALVTIAMGWFIGKSVRRGSGDRGGWRYGVLAVVLTYCAIGFSYFGAAMASELKDSGKPVPAKAVPAESPEIEKSPSEPIAAEPTVTEELRATNPLVVIMTLLVTAFLGPIVVATQSLMSALITGFGLWEAWKINRGVPPPEITGPHPASEGAV